MASTNKTTNYELSQYIGTDKPTYLTDYNQDMAKIDAGIHASKQQADTNANSIGTLSSLSTETKTDLVAAINEVNSIADTNSDNIANTTTNIATNTSAIGSLVNLTTTAKNNLVAAINEVNELEKYSLQEEPVGIYYDNKTIYRKVIRNFATLDNNSTLMTFNLENNVDSLVSCVVYKTDSNNSKETILPILAITPLRDEAFVDKVNHIAKLDISRDNGVHYNGDSLSATIEYTKYSENNSNVLNTALHSTKKRSI